MGLRRVSGGSRWLQGVLGRISGVSGRTLKGFMEFQGASGVLQGISGSYMRVPEGLISDLRVLGSLWAVRGVRAFLGVSAAFQRGFEGCQRCFTATQGISGGFQEGSEALQRFSEEFKRFTGLSGTFQRAPLGYKGIPDGSSSHERSRGSQGVPGGVT